MEPPVILANENTLVLILSTMLTRRCVLMKMVESLKSGILTIKTEVKSHFTDISKFLALITLVTVIFTLTLLYKLNKGLRKATSLVQAKISG